MTAIDLTCEAGSEHATFLKGHLQAACARLPAPQTLSVAVVNGETMSQLHQRFMGKLGPTDVLSFPLSTAPGGRVTEGEVVVCHPVAVQEAARRGHAVEHELLLYALHGLLHLCGYNDLDEASYAQMHAKEDEILEALGIGRVFLPGSCPAGAETRPR